MRERNNPNYSRGKTSGNERTYYDQMSSSYSNQSQPYYQQHHQNRNQPSSASRQKTNNNNNRNYRDNQSNRDTRYTTPAASDQSNDTNAGSAGKITRDKSLSLNYNYYFLTIIENRPRLQLLPRSQNNATSVDVKKSSEPSTRNSNIFGSGK